MASHRQPDDNEWYIKKADWKTELYITKNDIYFSSYISNDRKDWTTIFTYVKEEMGRGTWQWGESEIFKAPSKADFVDAASLVAKFTVKSGQT